MGLVGMCWSSADSTVEEQEGLLALRRHSQPIVGDSSLGGKQERKGKEREKAERKKKTKWGKKERN